MTNLESQQESPNEQDMWWVAEHLIKISIEVHMERFGVTRETARDWVLRAAEVAE
jgi:hypothetical protein